MDVLISEMAAVFKAVELVVQIEPREREHEVLLSWDVGGRLMAGKISYMDLPMPPKKKKANELKAFLATMIDSSNLASDLYADCDPADVERFKRELFSALRPSIAWIKQSIIDSKNHFVCLCWNGRTYEFRHIVTEDVEPITDVEILASWKASGESQAKHYMYIARETFFRLDGKLASERLGRVQAGDFSPLDDFFPRSPYSITPRLVDEISKAIKEIS